VGPDLFLQTVNVVVGLNIFWLWRLECIQIAWQLHCVQKKKHPLTFCFISPWIICGFKQKLQWVYPRIDRFWKCKN